MNKKLLNTLAAAFLLAALWAGFVFLGRKKAEGTSQGEADLSKPQEKIFPLTGSHIQSITLQPKEGPGVTCQREGGKWAIVEPQKLDADQNSVSSLLSTLTEASVNEVVAPHADNPAEFGLSAPSETLTVETDAQPAKFALLLGDDTPTGGDAYAQVAGNPRVITLPSYQKSALSKNLFDLRDKRVVTLNLDQVRRIDAESKGKRWTLEKNPEGVWDLVLPPPVRADRASVDGILEKLRGLSMQSIVAEEKKNASRYGFGAPTLRVVLSGPGGNQTLLVGEKQKDKSADRYVAMNSAFEPVFTLGSDFLPELQKDPADLRDKNLFTFSTFDVNRIELETPEGQRVFEQQKDKWRQTAPSARDEPGEKVRALLDQWRDLRADSFPKGNSLAAFGLTKPQYRLEADFGGKKEIVEASKVGDHVYARLSTDAAVSELPPSALDDIQKALKDL